MGVWRGYLSLEPSVAKPMSGEGRETSVWSVLNGAKVSKSKFKSNEICVVSTVSEPQ